MEYLIIIIINKIEVYAIGIYLYVAKLVEV